MEYKILVISSVQQGELHETKVNELASKGFTLKQAIHINNDNNDRVMYIFEKLSDTKRTLHS